MRTLTTLLVALVAMIALILFVIRFGFYSVAASTPHDLN
jgi:hypothetical protein